MTLYNPSVIAPPLANGDAFSSSRIKAAFDDLSTAINGAVDTTNNLVVKSQVPYTKFHTGAVTETFTSSSTSCASYPVIIDRTPAANLWGVRQNDYDVEDSGVDFYIHATATGLRFDGNCDLLKCKDNWNYITAIVTPVALGYSFALSLIVDGTTVRTVEWGYPQKSARMERRGFALSISHSENTPGSAYLAPGKHTAHLRLVCTPSMNTLVAPNYPLNWLGGPAISQFLSFSRSLSVHAIYI